MIGYDKIPSVLPPRPLHACLTPGQKRRRVIASSLAAQGLSEVQTFPFTSDSLIASMGYVGERAATYRLANPMSEDLPVLNPSFAGSGPSSSAQYGAAVQKISQSLKSVRFS